MHKGTVCFFNSTKAWGGGEKWHYDISTRLSKKKYAVILAAQKKGELYKRLRKKGMKVVPFNISNLSFLNPIKIFSLVRFFKKYQIRAVILNLPADLKAAGTAAKIAGVPKIIYRRGSAIPIKNSTLNRWLFKHVITAVITNSEMTKHTILANNSDLFPKNKIHVIYNGINLKKFDKREQKSLYEKKEQEIILGTAGRFAAQKNHHFLVDLAHELKKRNLFFKILLAGTGKLESEIKNRTIKENVYENFVFFGFQKNIKSFMCSIDLFLLPSLWEGFGYVIVEAMACHKPVIAFNTSSNPEIIVNRNNGILTPVNDIKAFADAIEKLYGNNKEISLLGNNAREWVEKKFDISTTVVEVEQVLG